MKKILPLLLLSSLSLMACQKDCDTRRPACKDVPPANELCTAFFSRWFYNAQSDQCQLIGYSGCSQKGFATQKECEGCIKSRKP